MSYQGKASDSLNDEKLDSVYSFLKKSLRMADHEITFRGPSVFSEGDLEYRFELNGDFSYFVGREMVILRWEVVFFQDVMGSMIK